MIEKLGQRENSLPLECLVKFLLKCRDIFKFWEIIVLSFLCRIIPYCDLEVESEVNFGEMIANNKLVTKEIHIANRGTTSGKYLVCIK